METPNKGEPNAMVDPGRNADTHTELLFVLAWELAFTHSGLVVALCLLTGGTVLVSIFFNWLNQRWRLLNHNLALLNLLPNRLHNLRSCSPK